MKSALGLIALTWLCLVPAVFAQNSSTGITVFNPNNGQSVPQNENTVLSMQTNSRRIIGSYVVTVAKPDGSGNITIAEKNEIAQLRVFHNWDVAASQLALGEYHIQWVVSVNTTVVIPSSASSSAGGGETATTATATRPVTPVQTGVPAPLEFYWRGTIQIVEPQSKSAASGLMHGQASASMVLVKALVALGVVAVACIISL
ncbi:hypothetical protein BG004_005804 [Podila humilis]|nr:hypothetical protein BG004_005804 [Podila humilis]